MPKKKRLPPFHCTREFYRAALNRYEEAKWILDNSPFTTAAVYLAGYAVECALKAVLLANTPSSHHGETKRRFRGKVAHDFEWLSRQLNDRGVTIPTLVGLRIVQVNWWNTDMRYKTDRIVEQVATGFLSRVWEIVSWAKRSV